MKHLNTAEQFIINVEDSEEPFKWTSGSVATLIQKVKLHWDDFNSSMKKKTGVWKTVSRNMAAHGYIVCPLECDKKFRNIKARYHLALENKLLRKKATRIEYFDELDRLLGGEPETLSKLEQSQIQMDEEARQKRAINDFSAYRDTYDRSDDNSLIKDDWPSDAIDNLLCLLKEFKDCFNDPADESLSVDIIWNVVSEHMQLKGFKFTSDECRQKWKSLVSTFRFYDKNNERESWPHFDMVEEVVLTVPIPVRGKKRRLSPMKYREEKKMAFESHSDDIKPSTSIKIESLEDSFEDHDDIKCEAKYSQILRAIGHVEQKVTFWRHLRKLEANLNNKQESFQKEIEERNVLLKKMTADVASLEANLAKRFPVQNQRDENITLVLPNTEDHSVKLQQGEML